MTLRKTLFLGVLVLLATATAAEARGPPAFVGSLAASDGPNGWERSGGRAQGLSAMAALSDEPAGTERPVAPAPTPTEAAETPLPAEVPQAPDLPVDLPQDSGPPAPPAPAVPRLPEVPAPAPAPAPRVPDAAEVATTWAPVGLFAIAVAAGVAPAIAGRGPFRRSPRDHAAAAPRQGPAVPRAMTLIAEGHAPEAAQTIRRALRHRPADPEARYVLGVALARDGKIREALKELEYAIRLNDVFLGMMVKDPALEGFVSRRDVHRFIRRHARAFHDRVHRAYA